MTTVKEEAGGAVSRSEAEPVESGPAEPRLPEGLQCLAAIYGGSAVFKEGVAALEFAGGRSFVFDDGKKKSPEERIQSPDLEDTLGEYRSGKLPVAPAMRLDTGRVRHLGLLREIYGGDEAAVRRRLVEVDFFGREVQVHERVRVPLERVRARLLEALDVDSSLSPYLQNLGGGFRFRMIEGTNRLSPHAFGIAVDLNPRRASYWRWNAAWNGEFPLAIVEAFEAEGFIWGGRWEHFDSMHFEYRPEIAPGGCSPVGAAHGGG